MRSSPASVDAWRSAAPSAPIASAAAPLGHDSSPTRKPPAPAPQRTLAPADRSSPELRAS